MFRALPIVLLGLALPAFATDPIVPLHQVRSVYAFEADWQDPNGHSEMRAAPDFGDWLDEVWLEAAPDPCAPGSRKRADAAQYSSLSTSRIEAYGVAEANLEDYPQKTVSETEARNRCLMRFVVNSASQIELTGSLAALTRLRDGWNDVSSVHASAQARMRVRQFSGATVYQSDLQVAFDYNQPPSPSPDDPNSWIIQAALAQPLTYSGTLQPGIYELDVTAESCAGTTAPETWYYDYQFRQLVGEASFCVELHITPVPIDPPCNADLDGDNDVDIVDLARMQQCWTGPR
jgi:hypothetical protein